MKRIFTLVLLFNYFHVTAQLSTYQINGISTAVPFLRITPDARAGGMGETGLATTPDAHSIFWNTAKLSYIKSRFGVSASYTPWIRALVNDVYLFDLSSFYKIDSMNAVTATFRYFSLGKVTFSNIGYGIIDDFNPNEFTIHLGYSRKILSGLSTGINLGYVYSNLAEGLMINGVPIRAGKALAIDLSSYYLHPVKKHSILKRYDLGLCLSNFGTKITYTESAEQRDFLPTNLGAGSSFHFQFGKPHQLSLSFDLNKLLVPTWDDSGKNPTFSTGAEYVFKGLYFLRGGYFYQQPLRGRSDYFTIGAGIKYDILKLDICYLIANSDRKIFLDNTYRLSLSLLLK